MPMNNRQQKEFDKINLFLEQFKAKIKDEYIHSELSLIILNKYGIERSLRADSIKYLSKTIDYWTFDGVMCDRQKREFKIIKNIAESKGGKILSEFYIDCEKKLQCMDKNGNHFTKLGNEIKKNKWSPFESKRVYKKPEYHLNELRKIVESKGGKLISTEYINTRTKLEIEDKNGTRFFMTSSDIKRHHWSPYEQNKVMKDPEYHLNILKEIAKKRGGELISTEYLGAKIKLEFEDSKQRRFFMTPDDAKGKKGRWSPYESGNVYNNPQYHLNILREIAESKGGKLISTEYINGTTKLEFEDRNNKKFKSIPNAIKRGQWSPFEHANLSEEKTRQCMEFIFSDKFPNIWGVIKKTTTNRSMQFDGYNEKLKIAFEYQGEQHYSWEDCRGKTEAEKKQLLKKITENDKEKLKLSKEQNILLIIIKYFENYKEDEQYIIHVINEIKNYNLDILNLYLENIEDRISDFKFDYNKMPTNDKYLKELRKIAKSKGGKLISTKYINNTTQLEFEDKNGNRFFRKPSEVKHNNRWSPYDVKKIRVPAYHFNLLKNLIESHNGKLISTEYINCNTKMEFEDQNGKKFYKEAGKIKRHKFD